MGLIYWLLNYRFLNYKFFKRACAKHINYVILKKDSIINDEPCKKIKKFFSI